MKRSNTIKDKTFGSERALYATRDTLIENCRIEGEEDGESALKECEDITVKDCYLALRYPLWHVRHFELEDCTMPETCRAALWYDEDGVIKDSYLGGIKAVRECKDIAIEKSTIVSPEFGWQSSGISLIDSDITSEYAFLHTQDLSLKRVNLKGKYTFQYTQNVKIENSELDTKDAFWHAENVTVTDSKVKGEYLGWYSSDLTFIRCHISGTQPLCYCKNLKLIDCTFDPDCDLAFEYSDVTADIKGHVTSIKNPRSGSITADSIGELIITDDAVYRPEAVVKTRL